MIRKIELLQKSHVKTSFNSEIALLDNYIKKQASQDVKKDLSVCYVLADEAMKVMGYYTLSSNSIRREGLPENLLKKLPANYHDLPAVLLGRLAVDKNEQKQGYGEILLMDAFDRCLSLSKQLGTLAIIVDPIDDNAINFYRKYGFLMIPSNNKMFIAMETIRKAY